MAAEKKKKGKSIMYFGMSQHTKIFTKHHWWPSRECSRLVILRLQVQTVEQAVQVLEHSCALEQGR